MKALLTKIKELFLRWKAIFLAFCKHPIQFTKDYLKNFKQLSKKEKVMKILYAVAFAAGTIYGFWVVVCVIVVFLIAGALLASGGVELGRVRRSQWMVNEYGGKEADYL